METISIRLQISHDAAEQFKKIKEAKGFTLQWLYDEAFKEGLKILKIKHDIS